MLCANGERVSIAEGRDHHCKALIHVLEFSGRLLLIRGLNLERSELPKLTPAEREVADLAAQGHSDRSIADRRRCASRTVSNQLASIYHKLGISGRRELRASLTGVRSEAPALDGRAHPAQDDDPAQHQYEYQYQQPDPRAHSAALGVVAASSGLSSPPLDSRLSCLYAAFAAVLSESWISLELIDDKEPSFLARVNAEPGKVPQLSRREREIFALAATGTSNKVISYALGLSVSTVSTHLRRARQKPVASQAELLLHRMGGLPGAL